MIHQQTDRRTDRTDRALHYSASRGNLPESTNLGPTTGHSKTTTWRHENREAPASWMPIQYSCRKTLTESTHPTSWLELSPTSL